MRPRDKEALNKLVEKWRDIADRLDNAPTVMTANTHRLFANELDAVMVKLSRKAKPTKGKK